MRVKPVWEACLISTYNPQLKFRRVCAKSLAEPCLKTLFRKSAARACFHVFFECACPFFICEHNISVQMPRPIFCGVFDSAGIMLFETLGNIICDSGIVPVWVVFTCKNINVFYKISPVVYLFIYIHSIQCG